MPVLGCILRDVARFPGGSIKDTSPMCNSPLRHGFRQATHNTLGLGSWSTVSYLFRDRPATRTSPRLSATHRRARWPLKPRGYGLISTSVLKCKGRDSSVGIATRYGLDGPGIESRCGRDTRIPHSSRQVLGYTQPPITIGTESFLGVNWLGCGVDHPPPSRAEVKGSLELYVYSPSGPSWPIVG
jgi:hypothetical protein